MAADKFTKPFAHPQNWLKVIRLTSVHPHPETQHNTSTTTFLVRPSIAYVGTLTAEDLRQEVAECAAGPVRVTAYSTGMLPACGDVQPVQAWRGIHSAQFCSEDSESAGHGGFAPALPSPQVRAETSGIRSARLVTAVSQRKDQYVEAYDQTFEDEWKIFENMLNQIAEQDDDSAAIKSSVTYQVLDKNFREVPDAGPGCRGPGDEFLDEGSRITIQSVDNPSGLSVNLLLFSVPGFRHSLGSSALLHARARFPIPWVYPGSVPRLPLARSSGSGPPSSRDCRSA